MFDIFGVCIVVDCIVYGVLVITFHIKIRYIIDNESVRVKEFDERKFTVEANCARKVVWSYRS